MGLTLICWKSSEVAEDAIVLFMFDTLFMHNQIHDNFAVNFFRQKLKKEEKVCLQ